MRIIYMGTPHFAAVILSELIKHDDIEVGCVVTKPDSVSKRGNKLIASEVKQIAIANNLECLTPKTLKDETVQDKLKSYNCDFICVAAYGKILPKEVLEIPKHECLNVHGSLLPK